MLYIFTRPKSGKNIQQLKILFNQIKKKSYALRYMDHIKGKEIIHFQKRFNNFIKKIWKVRLLNVITEEDLMTNVTIKDIMLLLRNVFFSQ